VLGVGLALFLKNMEPSIGGQLDPVSSISKSPREIAVIDYLENEVAAGETIYNGQKYSLVLFKESDGRRDKDGNELNNFPARPSFLKNDAGALLYKKNELIWESEEPIEKINTVDSDFIDINNDGIEELLLIDWVGEKLTGCNVFIYSFNNDDMELITPYEIISYQGINYKTSQIVDCTDIIDIDNDENIEIITEELNTITKEKIIRTYKFNGLKYSLWKEVTEPVQ
jgi:hypothetical protein